MTDSETKVLQPVSDFLQVFAYDTSIYSDFVKMHCIVVGVSRSFVLELKFLHPKMLKSFIERNENAVNFYTFLCLLRIRSVDWGSQSRRK